MKKISVIVTFCIISALIVPVVAYIAVGKKTNKKEKYSDVKPASDTIFVYNTENNSVSEMDMEEYLFGVVSAEMPAEFETEALKAQAVAARSYAVYRKKYPTDQHPNASVCTDYSHCKAYKDKATLEKNWGKDYEEYSQKINKAVQETKGEVITYGGEVALAVFHSQSGSGRTENSKDVWGGDVPYLVSVESHGEESAPDFYSSVTVSYEKFKEVIEKNNPGITVNSAEDIGELQKSEGGNVKNINIGAAEISGKDMRKYFGLRSTCFSIRKDGANIIFEVTGYGHGVGMSQYGANAMAKEGFGYKQILTHYYSGTVVEVV